ncbi:MAG: aminotransferase class I/II-fold pyridoxal phosphate-dependent enzyme [Vulcanimicrobiaceae bacterium]
MKAFLAAPHVEALPFTTPFVGPEHLMREAGLASLLRLGANESAFGPSPKAIEAMAAELPRLWWYGDPESYALRAELALKHGRAIGEIGVGAGIDDLMGLAVRAFLAPGESALATRGTYPTFGYHVAGYGGKLATVDYTPDGFVDVDALITAAHRVRPAILYVANPDNPSGSVLPAGEIERLCEALPERTLLFLDEAYAEFAENERAFADIDSPQVLRARTFSKVYGMAGARIGYAIAAERNVRTLQKICLQYGVNRNAQVGALAALGDDAFKQRVVAEVAAGRTDYYALARSLGRAYLQSHTNFVCIDFESAERATLVVSDLLRRGVFIRKPGAPPLDRFIRVSVGTPDQRRDFARHLAATAEALPS